MTASLFRASDRFPRPKPAVGSRSRRNRALPTRARVVALLAILAWFACSCAVAFGDSAPLDPTNLSPIDDSNIRLARETLTVDLSETTAAVDATFTFVNDGDARDVLMGFPPVDVDENDFRVWVDGRPIRVTNRIDAPFPFSWHVRFGVRSEHTVRVAYSTRIAGFQPFSPPLTKTFRYILLTGKRWKGPIGNLSVRITCSFPTSWILSAPPWSRIEGNTIALDLKNWEPSMNLEVSFCPLNGPKRPVDPIRSDFQAFFRSVGFVPLWEIANSESGEDLGQGPVVAVPFATDDSIGAVIGGKPSGLDDAFLAKLYRAIGTTAPYVNDIETAGPLLALHTRVTDPNAGPARFSTYVLNVEDRANPRLLASYERDETVTVFVGRSHFYAVTLQLGSAIVNAFSADGKPSASFSISGPASLQCLGTNDSGTRIYFLRERQAGSQYELVAFDYEGKEVFTREAAGVFSKATGKKLTAFAFPRSAKKVSLYVDEAGSDVPRTIEVELPSGIAGLSAEEPPALAVSGNGIVIGFMSRDESGTYFGHLFRLDARDGAVTAQSHFPLPSPIAYLSLMTTYGDSYMVANASESSILIFDARNLKLIQHLGGSSPLYRASLIFAREFDGILSLIARTPDAIYFLDTFQPPAQRSALRASRVTVPGSELSILERNEDIVNTLNLEARAEPPAMVTFLVSYGEPYAENAVAYLKHLGVKSPAIDTVTAPKFTINTRVAGSEEPAEEESKEGPASELLLQLGIGVVTLLATAAYIAFLARAK